jgi:hypothetical protein
METTRQMAQEAVDAYRASGGNKAKAAEAMGLSCSTFKDRLKAAYRVHGINANAEGAAFPVPPGAMLGNNTIYVNAAGSIVGQWGRVLPGAEEV